MQTIKLNDGTELTELDLNGNNYVSNVKIDESILTDENLVSMTITNFETKEVQNLTDMHLVQQVTYDDGKTYYLCFVELSETDKMKNSIAQIKPIAETLDKLVSVTETASDKQGYNWKITSIGNVEVLKEYVKNDDPDDQHDGSDYTKPAYYIVGASVEKGKWYCEEADPTLIWECIKSGTPSSFKDTEYFDIVIG